MCLCHDTASCVSSRPGLTKHANPNPLPMNYEHYCCHGGKLMFIIVGQIVYSNQLSTCLAPRPRLLWVHANERMNDDINGSIVMSRPGHVEATAARTGEQDALLACRCAFKRICYICIVEGQRCLCLRSLDRLTCSSRIDTEISRSCLQRVCFG